MSINWIPKTQEKQDTLYPIVTKKYHIPVLQGLQVPHTQNLWPGPDKCWFVDKTSSINLDYFFTLPKGKKFVQFNIIII